MRKGFVISLLVVADVFGTVAACLHFRILPINVERHAYSVPILSVNAPECNADINLSPDRAVILYAGPNVSWVTITGEYLDVPQLLPRLDDILRTRIDRVIHVLDSQDADSLVLEKMIAQMPYVARICVIDSRHPPSWYPPKRRPMSGVEPIHFVQH